MCAYIYAWSAYHAEEPRRGREGDRRQAYQELEGPVPAELQIMLDAAFSMVGQEEVETKKEKFLKFNFNFIYNSLCNSIGYTIARLMILSVPKIQNTLSTE